MGKSNFRLDLANSHKNTEVVKEVLSDYMYISEMRDTVGKCDYDLSVYLVGAEEAPLLFECKEDKRCEQTNNVFIETKQTNKKSNVTKDTGIFESAATEVVYTIHTKKDVLFIHTSKYELKKFVDENDFRILNTSKNYKGDYNISFGHVVNVNKLLTCSGINVMKTMTKEEYQCAIK